MSTYITFALSITLLIVSPGPVVSLVISESKYSFPRNTVAGALLASQILLIISLIVILSAFHIDPVFLNLCQFVGGIYLIYIAWSSFRHSATESNHVIRSSGKQFWKSLKIGLSNPKDILFFIAFLPTFITMDDDFFEKSIHLMLIWLIIDFLIMTMYSLLAQRIFASVSGKTIIHYLPIFSILGFGLLAVSRSLSNFL
ncbi:LysE family translocator [Vibrio mangrovi]|uniref:Leucine efflux protein n=1 Tax=Vibrio mangrovi TaxID=474394 RepID=A0A1Y6IVZ2_9VIBR|nr:LysE family translocator [Vibrio mangrovi]MDW6005059.1 LysE family translocator [Vibrio mangrovi]SMS01827.1 Leucine efflux protein [Vibrio mangrovi]